MWPAGLPLMAYQGYRSMATTCSLFLRDRTNNEIASELYVTPKDVKAHLASLMRKLGARNRVEVAMWPHETGRI